MGVGASIGDSKGASLLVDHEMRECAKNFITNRDARKEFAKFIKDGFWIDFLFQNRLLFARNAHAKMKTYNVTFESAGMLTLPSSDLAMFSSSGSSRSSRSCSRDSNVDIDSFSDLYANVQDRTCFVHGDMITFLFSVVFPLFMRNTRHAHCSEVSVHSKESDFEEAGELCTALGEEMTQMFRLQEILLGSAAYFDEADLWESLATTKWLDRLHYAVMDCPISVCVCSVERMHHSTSKAIHPVLVNHCARKRGSSLDAKDFFHLWSIEAAPDSLLHQEVTHSLDIAQPMRLVSSQYAPKTASASVPVLDVTHIFDEHGVHRYVLGVLMDVPEDGASAKHLQYLTDSALLISHIIKMPLPTGSQLFTMLKRSSSAVLRQNSTRF